MAAVCRDYGIGIIEVFADADGVGFLTGVQVREARDLPVHDLRVRAVLEFTDGFHLAVGPQQFFPG